MLLHLVAFHGLENLSNPLISMGGDVNARNKSLSTPLHLSVVGGHVGSCALLMEYGADVTSMDKSSYTPLHLAAYR